MDAITGIPWVTEESPYSTGKSDALGKDDFLKLFLAQMNHQDPLNPMESQEFTAQLAQFSSLEQLYNVNENLDDIRSFEDQSSRFQALDFIGKEVISEGDLLSLEEGESASGGFTLGRAADCVVRITDEKGATVRLISLGSLEAGDHSFQWDGLDATGTLRAPGTYEFEVTAVGSDGWTVPVETRIQGRVSRVNLEGTSPLLYVGEIPLTLSEVLDIRVPGSSAEDQPLSGEDDQAF